MIYQAAMTQADLIRSFVVRKLVEPAKAAGRTSLTVKAGDVHRMMGLANAYPAVCSALRGAKLQTEAGINFLGQEGPENGSNVWFRFDLSPSPQTRPHEGSPRKSARRVQSSSNGRINLDRALVLISCSKSKLSHEAAARDLYCSPAFEMKRAIVERDGAAWVILSAKHGVVEPTQTIEPYDTTLTTMGVVSRRNWTRSALPTLIALAKGFDRVVSLAGQRYTENLLGPLADEGIEVTEPMKGLRQGEQLAWLLKNL